MELKIFGLSGAPTEDFAKELKTLFDLRDSWDDLAKWFLTTDSFDARDDKSISAIRGSVLLPQQFFDCVSALRFILEAWQVHGLQLLDIQKDLFNLGYDEQEIDRLGALLRQIEPVKERVYGDFIRFEHENAVLPTLEDIDVVCDVRPIFEDYVFPAPVEGTGVDYKRLLGFSYMVLAELVTEDMGGKTRRWSFQMTEKSLADLQSALRRAREQLDILKASTRDLPIQNK